MGKKKIYIPERDYNTHPLSSMSMPLPKLILAVKKGRKPKYGEPTTTIAFRVPKSQINEIKRMVNDYLAVRLKGR